MPTSQTARQMRGHARKIAISGPAGRLEAILEAPAGAPAAVAAICHPHPLHAGTMHNKVVHMLARGLNDIGITTMRFNFRGVGASDGAFDEGRGETEDARAVLAWLAEEYPLVPQWLAGFSFGAFVALRLAQTEALEQLITVAPPVQRFGLDGLTAPDCPWLVVMGAADEIVDSAEVEAWIETLTPRPRLIMMPGVGHFFHGNLTRLRTHLQQLKPDA